MAVFEIPLTNKNQRVTVSLLNITYILTVRWNALAKLWYLDINDINDEPLLNGVPMVAGVDLLKQFKYLKIGGALIAQNVNTPNLPIDENGLGSTGLLLFIPYIVG